MSDHINGDSRRTKGFQWAYTALLSLLVAIGGYSLKVADTLREQMAAVQQDVAVLKNTTENNLSLWQKFSAAQQQIALSREAISRLQEQVEQLQKK